jgi:excisionase family DNA binding protein
METLNLPHKDWFLTKEAAEYLHMTLRVIQKWCKSGLLPATRLPGGHYRIHRAAIVKILDAEKE